MRTEVGNIRDMWSDRGAAYWLRRTYLGTWPGIAEAIGYAGKSSAYQAARVYAEVHGLEWPIDVG